MLSLFNVLAIPSSRRYTFLLLLIALLAGMLLDVKKNVKPLLIIILIATCIYFISTISDPRERRAEHISPNGSNTILIEYDYASRPSIYRKVNFLFMTPITFDFGAGYNETITHEIIWLSEDTFKLVDYTGSEWIVDIK